MLPSKIGGNHRPGVPALVCARVSRTEAQGQTLKYRREFKVKSLSVESAKFDALKKFYRQIAGDERSSAVLKHATDQAAQ